jgi:hypothetical protein
MGGDGHNQPVPVGHQHSEPIPAQVCKREKLLHLALILTFCTHRIQGMALPPEFV